MSPDTRGSVDPELLASLPGIHHPVVSPDGGEVAFYYDGQGRNDLYLFDRKTGTADRVTDGQVPRDARWPLLWSGDGERVYFHDYEGGDEQNDLAAWHRDGRTETVVAVDGQGILADTTTDGRYLLYASDEGEQVNLYRYDTRAGERVGLTEYDRPVWRAVYGPDDERIAYVANESATLENRDVYVMAADGTGKRRLDVGEEGAETFVQDWFPDGDRLLVSDNSEDLRRVGVYDLETDDVEWLGPHEVEESAEAVSPDGRYVLATRLGRAAKVPVVYDLDAGTGRELDLPTGFAVFPPRNFPATGNTFADERTVVFDYSRPDQRTAIYEYDLDADRSRALFEPDHGDVDPAMFVDADYRTYESTDGLTIGGILYDPRDGPAQPDDATDVPGVVVVHGGPQTRYSRNFVLRAQVLATRGYAVFQPNFRGSTGRGRAFKEAILNDWGGMEQADVAEGGRWLKNREWIDEDRVAVLGSSYGGYSVYSQLTQYPDRWTTGVAWMGITDLHDLYEAGMPHFQHQLREEMGDPEENHDLWRERSPVEHVEAMERPICILHGVNDPRVPVDQARQFRDALLDRGWVEGEDFEYTELGEEGHGSTDIEQKVRVYDLVVDYLGRRLADPSA